ncbi:IclR family transcriptional regulator [Microbacterium sp. cx-55]|uniref:IclR family transcriptional regulator n=1 Tax=unclassified Microbacterium TaxID=2609290 RepID=UPI001CBEF077|nr:MULTISPECIES: IclR family transcriptional regulator [unclassified Microbacterium]MBZ4487133.1 IclR family transcriptional regulator [Microbacterium sp. cx-55]MCC4908741.1 IclR family transcriptional regulator [Microbacterium sp. cx-59]UGB35168.1 IclR family transcriptional regulator [Microbacterium sp. cx-55]
MTQAGEPTGASIADIGAETATRRESAFVRGLKILTSVTDSGEARAVDIADDLGLPLSTVYRYLRTLREFALVEEHDGSYVAGWRLAELSGHDRARARLVEVGFTILDQLTRATGETSVMTARIGTNAMCLRQVESPKPERIAFRTNQLLPLHAGTGQRVLLAHAPASVITHVVSGRIRQVTDRTLRADALVRELQQIRERGWAVSRGELTEGAVAVAVPVFALGGEVVCSLAVAGVESRCDDAWIAKTRARLLRAAASLSALLDSPVAASRLIAS